MDGACLTTRTRSGELYVPTVSRVRSTPVVDRLFLRLRSRYSTGELEYRFWPTATLSDAKVALESIREQRQIVWRRMSAAAART